MCLEQARLILARLQSLEVIFFVNFFHHRNQEGQIGVEKITPEQKISKKNLVGTIKCGTIIG